MACNEVQILKTTQDVKTLHSSEEVKSTRYDASTIKDSMLDNLLSNDKSTMMKQWEELLGDKGLLSGFRSVRDKTMALKTYLKKNPFGKRIGDLSEGEARPIAIAIKHLHAAQRSEEDLVLKYKLKATDIAAITDINNDMTDLAKEKRIFQTSYSNMARTIGRDILKSRGYRLVPRSQEGVRIAMEQEIQVGEQALAMLEKRGLLSINPNGAIINRNFRKADGSPDFYSETEKQTKRTTTITGIKTVTLHSLFPHPEVDDNGKVTAGIYKSIEEYFEDVDTSSAKLKAVINLVLPSNSAVPSTEAQPINEAIQDIDTTDNTRAVIAKAQESSLKIQGFAAEALQELYNLVTKGEYKTTKNHLMALSKYASGSKASKNVFGTIDPKAMYDIYMDDMVGVNQQYGQSTSKVLPIVRLFDDFNLLDKEIYHTFQTAVQNRLHVFEQTLNYQTDAFFARAILGSPEVQVLGTNEINYLMGYIKDETKLQLDEILGTSNSADGILLNEIMDSFSNPNKSELAKILGLGKLMDSGKLPGKLGKMKSAWEVANYLQAIKDIRDGYSKGEVKTHFLAKPDATASGALITVLQASGRTPAAKEVVEDLFEMKRKFNDSEVAEEFNDMYELSTKVLEKELKRTEETQKDILASIETADKEVFDTMRKLMDPTTGVVGGPRDLMKLPFTKFIYGQAKYNNILEISKELASEMIDSNKEPLMKDMLGLKATEDLPKGYELRVVLIAALAKENGVADKLVSIVEESTGEQLFHDQSKALEDIHKLLEDIRFCKECTYDQIRVVPPLATLDTDSINDEAIYAKTRSKYGATIEKWQEAVIDGEDGALTTIKKHFPNLNSIKVLLQHMTDAAILVRALDDVYTQPRFRDYKNGLMLNHDSVGSTTDFAIALEDAYKQQIIEVNKQYDFVEAALRELKYAKSQIKNNPELLAKVEEHIKDTEAQLSDMIAIKQNTLGNRVIETSFGVSPKVKKEVEEFKPKIKPEAKVENTKAIEPTQESKYDWEGLFFIPTNITSHINKYIEDLRYPVYSGNKDVSNASNILEFFDLTQEEFKELSKKLDKQKLLLVDEYIKQYNGSDKLNTGNHASYDPSTNSITVIAKIVKDPRTGKKVSGIQAKQAAIEIFMHELEHRNTFQFLSNNFQDKDVQDLLKHMHHLRSKIPTKPGIKDYKNLEKHARAFYATNGVSHLEVLFNTDDTQSTHKQDIVALSEFIAILYAEPAYRDYLLNLAEKQDRKSIMTTLKKVIKKLFSWVKLSKKESAKYIKSAAPSAKANEIMTLVDTIHDKGLMFNSSNNSTHPEPPKGKPLNFVDVVNQSYEPYNPKTNKPKGVGKITAPVADTLVSLDAKMAELIQNTMDRTIDVTANKLGAKAYHEKMMKSSRIYRDTFNGIARQWDENTLISKIKRYINPESITGYGSMNKITTAALHAEERKASLEQKEINELQTKLTKLYNEDEVKQLHKLLSETPLFNLDGAMINELLSGSKSIDDAINEIETSSKLTGNRLHNARTIAKDLAEFYINKVPPRSRYNTDLNLPPDIADATSKLSALYALKLIDNVDDIFNKIESSKEHKELFTKLHEIALANKTLDTELHSTITYKIDQHSGNLNHMVFERNNEIRVVTMDNIDRVMSSGLGWEVLRKPTKTKAGIIYRDVGDISYQSGVGTNLKMDPNLNLSLPSKFQPLANNAIERSDKTAKIILTNEELDKLGLIRNPVYSLIKAHTHRMMLLETQAIREEIVNKFTYGPNVDPKDIVKDIKDDKHLWYIKAPKDTTLADMPDEVKLRYTEAHAKSDAGGFNDQVTWVRKDIKDSIEGYKEIQIGETGTTLNKAFNILKKSILLQKIHWVITAPTKVMRDAISNVSYLMSRNVPVNVIYSKTKRVMNEMTELNQLREELLHAEFKNRIKTTPAMVAHIAKLENDIKTHPLAAAHFNGFIQSLAIELSSKNEHTISGLHKDISSLIGYLFRDDKGALNMGGKALMKMSKFGINGEDLLISLANKLGNKSKSPSPKAMAEALEEMGKHIKDIKDKDDIEAYVQEYLGTPGTSMVAIGSAAVQAVDVIAKVIDYENSLEIAVKKFKKDNKREPNKIELKELSDKAAQDALQNFIDYKVNIPREFRFLEQTGITSFISFTSRIQRVMLRSLRNNPVNAAVTIVLNDMLNLEGGSTIFDANIFERNIFKTPSLGMDVIFPTKILG